MNSRGRAVLLGSIGLAIVVAGSSVAGAQRAGPPRGLLLWNTLGSVHSVTHSAYGPDLSLYDCHDRTLPSFGAHCSIDVRGRLTFVRSPFSRAAMVRYGPYFPEARVHTALLRESILDPEHGAVEAWYRQRKDPKPYVDNPHNIFGGPYDLTGDDVNLFVQDRVDSGDPRLHFSVYFGGSSAHLVWARSLDDGGIGYPISNLNERWIHVAGLWDRRGIAGSRDTVRLYVNGKLVARSRSSKWGATPCGTRAPGQAFRPCAIDVVGCNDTCAGTFAVDNLKVWSYARAD